MTFHKGWDGLKSVHHNIDCPEFLRRHKPVEYANVKTGEIKYPIELLDGAMSYMVLDANNGSGQYIKIQGSIHAYHNQIKGLEANNYNQFDQQNTVDVINHIHKTYGCLLYTSPSPRDATLSRMPSSA